MISLSSTTQGYNNKIPKNPNQKTGKVKVSLFRRMFDHKLLYLFILPSALLCFIFSYVPMYGVLLAFKDYKFNLGILGSPWVGFKYFSHFLQNPEFWNVVKNTLTISLLKLLFNFPAPIILALLLNEITNLKFKKTVQTLSYLPHFVSWVVVITIMNALFSPYGGLVNNIRNAMGLESLFILGEKSLFLPIVVLSEMWKGIGWGSIIYLSSIAGIGPELYEAAICDGAGKLRCTWNITLPGIRPTIGIMFIFAVGGILSVNFEQILLLQQPGNIQASQVLDTYVLNMGIQQGRFGYATAVGLFRSVMGVGIMFVANWISNKTMEVSIW